MRSCAEGYPVAQTFDSNAFKKAAKDWIRENPDGALQDFTDFCEEQIPSTQFAAYGWLLEQTVSWYRHILARRDTNRDALNEPDEAIA